MDNLISRDELTFLYESNKIEEEMSARALLDAIDAWQFALTYSGPMDLPSVLGIHKCLAQHLHPEIAGQLRTCAVWIGGKLKEAPLYSKALEDELGKWCDTSIALLKEAKREDLEMAIRNLHVMFEELHPFVDFNGRTGRILMNWQRVEYGLPIEIIYDKNKHEYYEWFRR